MVGWHHWLNGHEFEQALRVVNGQGSLVCCSPSGRKESDMTERLNWTDWMLTIFSANELVCLIFRVVCILSYVLFIFLSCFLPLMCILSNFYPLWLREVVWVIKDLQKHKFYSNSKSLQENGQENIRKEDFKAPQGLFKTYLAQTRFNFSCKSKSTKACNRYAFPNRIFTVLDQNRRKFFWLGTV